jgi:D-amino peptidase
MTRLLIVTDMEGISGLEHYEQCEHPHPDYRSGAQLLCDEVNVIGDEALRHGVASVSVLDLHGGGGNIEQELLDNRIRLIPEDLSEGFDLAFLVGFHAMAGDQTGFISHTMTEGLIVEVSGEQVGEIALWSWWLGDHGIPVGLIAGDRAATVEAERFSVDIPSLTVKQAETWARASCIPLDRAYQALRERVAYSLRQTVRWRVYRAEHPLRFRLRLRDENEIVPLIPWLEAQEDGWLAGEVSETRDLIDLIDVISVLMGYQARSQLIARLTEDPSVRSMYDQFQLGRINESIERNPWTID